VLAQVQRLLTTPEMIGRTWTAIKGELDEREVLGRLADFGSLWTELFPGEQARIMRLLIERVDVQVNGLEVRLRAEGLASLMAELRQQPVAAKAARSMRADSRLDGGTLVVRIPMRLGRQRGRKRILAPDGSELTPPTNPQADGVLVKALARAWRWQKLLDAGVHCTVTEIAEAERISKSYVSRILRLALLAPDLVVAILGGWADQRIMPERLERPLPVGWEDQRRAIARDRSAMAQR
jgi:hypothetical protein